MLHINLATLAISIIWIHSHQWCNQCLHHYLHEFLVNHVKCTAKSTVGQLEFTIGRSWMKHLWWSLDIPVEIKKKENVSMLGWIFEAEGPCRVHNNYHATNVDANDSKAGTSRGLPARGALLVARFFAVWWTVHGFVLRATPVLCMWFWFDGTY